MTSAVPDFAPAVNGLHFPNAFAHAPVQMIDLPLVGRVPVGDAANGLCGGMVFTVRDLAEYHREPPADTAPPLASTRTFAYIARRLVDSFGLPQGPLRYYSWMSLPDDDTPHARGVASLTRAEAERVRTEIGSGHLCCLGLVRVRSADPRELGKNHQVLAYAYDADDASGRTTLRLYDPNHPGADTQLAFTTDHAAPLDLTYSTGEPTRGFFVTPYERSDPAELFGETPVTERNGPTAWARALWGWASRAVPDAWRDPQHG